MKKLINIVLICGIICIGIVGVIVVKKERGKEKEVQIVSSSQLEKVVQISELSTAKLTYNGIAETYVDDEKCYIKYNGTVKVGIDIEKIKVDMIDDEKKIVVISLPKIELQDVDVNPGTFGYIPGDVQMEIGDAAKICRADILNEVKKNEQFFDLAKKSEKTMIEALTKPLLQDEGYTIKWKEE